MIEDFQTFEDGREFEADICIIGAGAAGITMARELAGGRHRVLLLESGGLEFEEETQDLYRGNITGLPYIDLDATRLRYFGGTTNHWAGYCLPMGEIDFRVRPWVRHSGWPISRADLEPFYRLAAKICQLGEFAFDSRRWQALGVDVPAFDIDKLIPVVSQLSPPVRFGESFREELEKAENIRVLLHANVVEIVTDATAKTVDHVQIRTLERKKGKVRARYFVLACGGMENVRLLLNSNKVEPHGVGNRHDLVGRFFMEHPIYRTAGTIVTNQSNRLVNMFLERWYDNVRNRPRICVSEQVQEREESLNAIWGVVTDADRNGAVASARKIWVSLKNKAAWPEGLGDKVWRVLSDIDDVAVNAYNEFVLGREPVAAFERIRLSCVVEPAPNPDSRVTLAEERDSLDLRRLNLDWRLTDMDRHTFLVVAKTAASELARTGLGRVRLSDWLADKKSEWPELEPANHHMGTTRMAADPKQGVVQKDCRVHGMDNFYIAGSSVFPTVSHSGTTITIVALAVRLADHLKERLA